MDRRLFLKILSMSIVGACNSKQSPILINKDFSLSSSILKTFNSSLENKSQSNKNYSEIALFGLQEEKNIYLCIYDISQNKLYKHAFPCFIHSVVRHPLNKNRFLAFPHKPGTIAVEFDIHSLDKISINQFESEKKYHFYGHGSYSPNGKLILNTENDTDTDIGKITIRDADRYNVLGKIEVGHLVGPHDMLFLPDNNTLVVAFGGRMMRPDYKIDKDSLDSRLVFLDFRKRIISHTLRLDPEISLRHLSVQSNFLAVGMVKINGVKNSDDEKSFLSVVNHNNKNRYELKSDDINLNLEFRNKFLSVAIDEKRHKVLASSPDSGKVILWDFISNKIKIFSSLDGPKGVSLESDGDFLITCRDGIYKLNTTHQTTSIIQKFEGMNGKGKVGSHLLII